MKSFVVRAAGAVLAALVAAGCSTVFAGSAASPGLDGSAWVLSDLPGKALVPQSSSTLQFAAGRASGSDSCNRFAGAYTQDKSALSFGQLVSTQMACAAEVMEQARAVTTALSTTRSHRISADTLELLGADGRILAVYEAQSTQLPGTEWTAIGINNGKGGVASLVAGSTVTLAFGTDGRASGSAGCNRYTASYESARDTLKFGTAAATRMMCATEGVMEQEQAFLSALGKVATFRTEGDRLELRGADGALAASFRGVTGGK
jgi:heat shock protein HslJ